MFKRWTFLAIVILFVIFGYFVVYYFELDINFSGNDNPVNPKVMLEPYISHNALRINLNHSLQLDSQSRQKCSNSFEKHNIVFIKTHKTGTSTFVNVLYRFGLMNGLNFAIYPYTHQLMKIDVNSLMELPRNETFNIMCQHMVFNYETVKQIMPADSFYFSLLREPVSAFISYFIFYLIDADIQIDAGKNLTLDGSINMLLNEVDYILRGRRDTFLVKREVNSMIYDFGISNGVQKSFTESDIESFINSLDTQIDLMMSLEKLDESLMLLSDELCWNDEDMFYLRRMQSVFQDRSHEPLREYTLDRLKHYLTPDIKLYNHFHNKLLQRLSLMPPQFQDKVKNFKKRRKEYEERCLDTSQYVPSIYHTQQHPLSKYGQKSLKCNILAERDTVLTKIISLLQDPNAKERRQQRKNTKFMNLEMEAMWYYKLGDFPRKWKLIY